MADRASISTWDALRVLGFEPDAGVISDEMPGLSFDFGNFVLSASAVLGKWFEPVVLFSGVLATPRTLADVCFELPRTLGSRQQLIAFLAHYLDRSADGGVFQPVREVDWLTEGRSHRSLLPWEVDKAAYEARPHCRVQRDWLRLALKNLAQQLNTAAAAAAVELDFDGSVLSIRCAGQVIPISASGKAWDAQFSIPAGQLRSLPKRLAQAEVEVAVWKGRLVVGGRSFDGATKKQQ